MILVIDNYDSFTYNLVQYVGSMCRNINVIKNDKKNINEINFDKITHILISPGPGRPEDSKLSLDVIDVASKKEVPLLGICLGHQALGYYFKAEIINCNQVMHGKTSLIKHNCKSKIFNNINITFEATRYHSLIISNERFPKELRITSSSNNVEIMSIEHKTLPLYGVQFHPESIKTHAGYKIIKNFLNSCSIQ